MRLLFDRQHRSSHAHRTRTARRNSRILASVANPHRYVLRTTHAIRDTYCVRHTRYAIRIAYDIRDTYGCGSETDARSRRSVAIGERQHVVYDGDLKRVGRRQDGPCAVKALALGPAPVRSGHSARPTCPAHSALLHPLRDQGLAGSVHQHRSSHARQTRTTGRNSRNFASVADLRRYALRITHYALRITHYALRITHYALRTAYGPERLADDEQAGAARSSEVVRVRPRNGELNGAAAFNGVSRWIRARAASAGERRPTPDVLAAGLCCRGARRPGPRERRRGEFARPIAR
jgi:hypothetical protein